jgi:acyl carrier protein
MEEEIKNLIRKAFPESEISEETNLSHLAHDSFARIEMLMEIEHSIGVIIPEDDILDMETVGDLMATVKRIKK